METCWLFKFWQLYHAQIQISSKWKGTYHAAVKLQRVWFRIQFWESFVWLSWTTINYSQNGAYCPAAIVNSLRPSDAIWRQWSWTTLAQVMACCLTAPSHYLNQCWLIIRGVLWHTSESSFAGIAQGIDSGYEFEKDILKNIFKSPRGQWVNAVVILALCYAVKSLQLIWRSGNWRFHLWVPDLQMSCSDLT